MHPKNLILIISAFIIAIITNGCATVLTASFPAEESFVDGGKSIDSTFAFNYTTTKNGNTFTLYKNPLCMEREEIIKVSQKRLHGIIGAVLTIPVYGLGVADWIFADLYSKSTAVNSNAGYKYTGKIKACGEKEKVPSAALILQFPETEKVKHINTDENAQFNLDNFYKDKNLYLINIYVNEGDTISYLTTIEKY